MDIFWSFGPYRIPTQITKSGLEWHRPSFEDATRKSIFELQEAIKLPYRFDVRGCFSDRYSMKGLDRE